jgi:hypothetical protein
LYFVVNDTTRQKYEKVARCVLRGLGEGDLAWLPGGRFTWGIER